MRDRNGKRKSWLNSNEKLADCAFVDYEVGSVGSVDGLCVGIVLSGIQLFARSIVKIP
jgi:hypothetical protein